MSSQNEVQVELSDQQKVVSLFQFVKELNKLKQKVVLNYSEYPWVRTVSSFPNDPDNISVFYRDRVENDDVSDSTSVLLSVRKPEFDKCPEPKEIFSTWLQPGWESFRNEAAYIDKKELPIPAKDKQNAATSDEVEPETIESHFEYFADVAARVNAYNAWLEERKIWVERQNVILQTRNLIADLYR